VLPVAGVSIAEMLAVKEALEDGSGRCSVIEGGLFIRVPGGPHEVVSGRVGRSFVLWAEANGVGRQISDTHSVTSTSACVYCHSLCPQRPRARRTGASPLAR
jgi:hypothetical protein